MRITKELVDAFLRCETKAYLRSNASSSLPLEFSRRQQSLGEQYREECHRLLRAGSDGEWYSGTPDLRSLKSCRYQLILDYIVALPETLARLDALVLNRRRGARTDCPYIPIHFVPNERVSALDKLLLTFDAFAFSKIYGKMPRIGRIIHGCQYRTVTVSLPALLHKVRRVLGSINDQRAKTTPPPLALNKHCAECEFQSRCRQIAVQTDDLSLLSNISEKERKRQNARGIFTVLQLSYTFRSPRRSAHVPLKHLPALKALAIRKNRIHILGTPAFSLSGTPTYLDVEGDPDRDFYYLIGLRSGSGGSSVHYSHWANTQADEREMWANSLRTLGAIASPRLIHYGAYETQFLKRMRTRYPDVGTPSRLFDQVSVCSMLTVTSKVPGRSRVLFFATCCRATTESLPVCHLC